MRLAVRTIIVLFVALIVGGGAYFAIQALPAGSVPARGGGHENFSGHPPEGFPSGGPSGAKMDAASGRPRGDFGDKGGHGAAGSLQATAGVGTDVAELIFVTLAVLLVERLRRRAHQTIAAA